MLDGLELIGNNANITYEAALKVYNDNVSGEAGPMANFNTNGISIGGPRLESKFPHHVTIRNCRVHDFPGGISSIQADYTTIENNVVYNNAWYMMYGGSGISILTPFNVDRSTGYKNVVRNNMCNTNKTTIPWIAEKRLSDGNGIDVNQHGYDEKNPTAPNGDEPYVGRTLVTNNVSVNNGGSGIHAFKADHVDIINNTAYGNGIVVNYPDIFANTCQDVNMLNNIMYARNGGSCNSNNKNVNVLYDCNLYFNGAVVVKGTHDMVADPNFVKPSTDLALADFRLTATSPAIDKGSDAAGQFSPMDILGTSRPQGTKPDMGAYEFKAQTVVTGTTEPLTIGTILVSPNPTENQVITVIVSSQHTPAVTLTSPNGQPISVQVESQDASHLVVRPQQRLSAGVYILIVKTDKATQSRRVVVP